MAQSGRARALAVNSRPVRRIRLWITRRRCATIGCNDGRRVPAGVGVRFPAPGDRASTPGPGSASVFFWCRLLASPGNHDSRPAGGPSHLPRVEFTHVLRSAFLATLPRRVPRGTDAAAVQHLDPAARARGAPATGTGCSPTNRFVLQWVKERFLARITDVAAETEGHPVSIVPAVADGAADDAAGAARAPAAADPCRCPRPSSGLQCPRRLPPHGDTSRRASIPSFTFATFVAGKANQLARAAGMQVAEHPDVLQPAVRLWRRRPRQDAPDPGDRQSHPAARPGGEDPLHPCRDLRLRRRARLPAQGVRRFQALLPLARPAADRRHPVLQRQEPDAGGVLLPVQHADRGAQAGRHHLRHVPEGDLRASRSA